MPFASSWPQWRGPRRDGVAVGARLPERLPESLPVPRWRVPVGIGYASPVVENGMVFAMGRDDAGKEWCYGIDDASGKVRWKHGYASAFVPPDPTAGKGPNSTPTIDRDRVYALGLGGMFHCLDARTGRVLWKRDFAREFWGSDPNPLADNGHPVCGAAASALADGDTAVIPVGGPKGGSLAAFDRRTGAVRWKALDDRSSYASPLLAEIAGVRQWVAFTGKRMVGLDAATRALLWEHPFKAMYEQTIATPALWRDRVLVSGEARPTVALEIGRSGAGMTVRTAWQNPELSAYLVSPVVVADHAIGMDHRSRRLVCVAMETGKTAWTSGRVARQFAALTVAGGRLLAVTDLGEIQVVAADPKAFAVERVWKAGEPGQLWSQLAVVDNRIYVRDQKHLSCYAL